MSGEKHVECNFLGMDRATATPGVEQNKPFDTLSWKNKLSMLK